jgi:hypothetical protein
MQPVVVVMVDDPADHLPGLDVIGQFVLVNLLADRPVVPFDEGVVCRRVRPDQRVPDLRFGQRAGELTGDEPAAVVALDHRPAPRFAERGDATARERPVVVGLQNRPLFRRQRGQRRGGLDRYADAVHPTQQRPADHVPRVHVEETQQVVIPPADLHVTQVRLPLLVRACRQSAPRLARLHDSDLGC